MMLWWGIADPAMLEERVTMLEAKNSDLEARLVRPYPSIRRPPNCTQVLMTQFEQEISALWQANIQVEAGEALDIAERATTLLQQEKTQLQLQNDDLKATLASQVAALADSTRRVEALEQDLEDATKKAAQVYNA